jgi:arabinofuranosyltransferase
VTSVIDETDLLVPYPLVGTSLDHRGSKQGVEQDVAPPASGSEQTRRSGVASMLQAAALGAPVVALAGLIWTHRNLVSDGYIYLRVVQNILSGHGPVFNVGQRVEVFTSPAWTAVLASVAFVTRLPLPWLSVTLGALLTLGGLSVALAASSRLVRRTDRDSFLLPIGAVVFMAIPPVWSLATTGLETGLVFFWLAVSFAVLLRWSRTEGERMPVPGLVVLGIGVLIRPELFIDSVVFIGVVLLAGQRSVSTGEWARRVVVWAFALPVLYEVFRMGYYGSLVANTAITKEAALPSPGRGIQYFSDFVGPYWLFIPIGALLFGAYYPLSTQLRRLPGCGRSHLALLALPVAGALNAGYIIVIGGDYIHARLFMAPLFALCVPVAVVPLARRNVLTLVVIPWAVVCALSLRTYDNSPWAGPAITSVNGHGSLRPSDPNLAAAQERAIRATKGRAVYVQFEGPGSIERLSARPAADLAHTTVATSWIGPEPYALGPTVQIVDLLGLADPLTAHLRLTRRGQIAGHEKPLPTPWVAAVLTADGASTAQLDSLQRQRPTAFTPLIPAVTGKKLTVETAWARAALQCPAIRSLRDSPKAPLTVASFFANVYHSFSRTVLRIPPDPETAYHAFCGPGTPRQVREAARRL